MTASTGPVSNPSASLQLKKDKAAIIETKLLELDDRIGVFCPRGMTAAHVRHSVMVAIGQNSKLLEATPMSVVLSALVITQWGLQVGQTAFIIPYAGVATPVAHYRGKIELICATRLVKHVNAKEIRELDEFDYSEGDHPVIVHRPAWKNKNAPIIGAYVSMPTVAGGFIQDVMNVDQIEAIRAKSHEWKPAKCKELPYWYARKTVVHRGAKYAPQSPRLQQALAFETDAGDPSEEALDLLSSENIDALQLGAGGADGAPSYEKDRVGAPIAASNGYGDEVVL